MSTSSIISFTILFISRTICELKKENTFVRDRHDLVLSVSMLEDTLATEHFLIALAEEFNLLLSVGVAVLNPTVFCSARGITARAAIHLRNGESREDCIIYWQVVGR